MKKKSLLLTIALMLSFNTTTFATNLDRLGGKDRYETASLINNQMESETLILASGNDFADALSATSLISYYNGEIHLVNKELDSNTIDSLKNNEFKKAIIVGGTGVISTSIENQLKLKLGFENVQRLGGANRYETSELIAAKILEINESVDTAFVATGRDFADALSVAPIAANYGYPIVLTPGYDLGRLGVYTLENVDTYYKIGGNTIVNDVIDDLVINKSLEIKRLYGDNRYETNKAVIDEFYLSTFNHDTLYVASGLDFPDALAGSALAAKNKAPIVFVGKTIDDSTQDVVNLFQKNSLIALGGAGVVSNETISKLNQNSEDREAVFKYKNKIVLPIEKGEIPTADDISLVALDKEGNDCVESFTAKKSSTPESSENGVGTLEFSVTVDGQELTGTVEYTRK